MAESKAGIEQKVWGIVTTRTERIGSKGKVNFETGEVGGWEKRERRGYGRRGLEGDFITEKPAGKKHGVKC